MRYPLLLLALLALAGAARAQLSVDTAHVLVGAEARLPLRLHLPLGDTSQSIAIEGRLHLSNATVFFPERFASGDGTTLATWKLDRITDSTYTFSFVAPRVDSGEVVALLAGEALAGFDSICTVTFSVLRLNGESIASTAGVVLSESVGPPLPYVRYATLERNYPNPIRSGETTRWAYRIDKASSVIFHFYNIVGQEHFTADLGLVPAGVYEFAFTPTVETATGLYIVRMETNTGDAFQYMHVLR